MFRYTVTQSTPTRAGLLRSLPVLFICVLLSTCRFPPSLLDQIMQRGELRVVTRNTPATFYIGADEPRGIEFELAQGFANRLGVQLLMYPAENFRHILPEVAAGKADVG